MTERAFLIAYDISDNRRRNRVAKYLEARGERMQKSLFVCRLGPAAARRIRHALEGMIDPAGAFGLASVTGTVGRFAAY